LHPEILEVLHYDPAAKLLSVEDPQFVFYLRNIPWNAFSKNIGFADLSFNNKYDFALSFAGSDRKVAEAIFKRLEEEEVEVFYDRNEQHRIIARDVEEYLRPIYQSEAAFVVCLLGPEYPDKVWTRIESDAFKDRFASGEVIPICFDTLKPGAFEKSRSIGHLDFFTCEPMDEQIDKIVITLLRKLGDARQQKLPLKLLTGTPSQQ
jgi:hypothetical protein